MQAPPMQAPMPPQQNPYGLVPPARIPSARLGADPVTTASIAKPEPGKKGGQAKQHEANLMSPMSIAEEVPASDAASVFDLFSRKKSD
jgi:hypothetical protein